MAGCGGGVAAASEGRVMDTPRGMYISWIHILSSEDAIIAEVKAMKPFFEIPLLENLLRQNDFTALLFLHSHSWAYYTGIPWRDKQFFSRINPKCGVVVPVAGYVRGRTEDAFMVVENGDYADAIRYGTWIMDVRKGPPLGQYRNYAETIVQILKAKKIDTGRVGLEKAALPNGLIDALKEAGPNIEWVDGLELILKLQEFKAAEEIRRLRVACQLNDAAILKVFSGLEVGVTPQQLMALYLQTIAGNLSDRDGHFTGVFFGDHHLVQQPYMEVKLALGTLVHQDQCVAYMGLVSDLGRNCYFGGAVPSEVEKLSRACNTSVEVATQHLKPGVPCFTIDRLVRETFDEIAGDSKARLTFGNISHGAGWNLYGYPFISPKPEGELLPGHVFAMEVYVHYPGLGHFKCEDMFAMHPDGAECLTSLPRELYRNS